MKIFSYRSKGDKDKSTTDLIYLFKRYKNCMTEQVDFKGAEK
jgi:hypothetical protein